MINSVTHDVRFVSLWELGSAVELFNSEFEEFEKKYGFGIWNEKDIANKIWDFIYEANIDNPDVIEAFDNPDYFKMLAMDIGVMKIGDNIVHVLKYDWTKNGFKLQKR